LVFGVGLRVVEVVERRQAAVDALLEVFQAAAIDFVVEHGVAGRALLHELGEEAGFVGGLPLLGHLAEEQVAHRPALPEGDDAIGVDLASFR
jgi:hypothetical protein